jgi:uncharacterized repeat protein (TIGR02543 family)
VANLVTSWTGVPPQNPPVTTATLSGTLQSGVYVSPVEVTLTATDYPGGVAATYYEIDGGSQQTYYGPFTVSAPGNHTVGFHSVSETGVVEATKYVSFTISASNFSLTVSFSGNGTVTSNDGNISCPGTCSYVYPANTQVTLNATATQGWTFVGWTGACSGTGSCAVTMTQSFSGNAIFAGSGALQFIATPPCRLVDTRGADGEFGGPSIQGGTARSFPIPQNQNCNIPASAAAYSLNVTVVPHGFLGYLTMWPTGENQPVVSTLNSYGRPHQGQRSHCARGNNGASACMSNTTERHPRYRRLLRAARLRNLSVLSADACAGWLTLAAPTATSEARACWRKRRAAFRCSESVAFQPASIRWRIRSTSPSCLIRRVSRWDI